MSIEHETKQKAETIIWQISLGVRMACGMRDIAYWRDNGRSQVVVSAKVLRGSRQRIRVTLELNDTYTVERRQIPTVRAKDQSIRVLEKYSDIYADQLSEIVYDLCNK